jgi:tRNA (guanine37-N1)-methyltransferase
MLRFDILTLFPALCEGAFQSSILGKAQENGLIQVRCLNIRDWATDKHQITDEPPYGGGAGMVMKAEPIFLAVETLRQPRSKVILLGPGGRGFTHSVAAELAQESHLILVCGHYEGVDQRVADYLADEELSIGDYVLTNGAIAAAVVVDATARLLPGVLGADASARSESFVDSRLEYPHYTRPRVFRGWKVPAVLLSGHHADIEAWRREQAEDKTRKRRPDLLYANKLTDDPAKIATPRQTTRQISENEENR